MSELREPDKWMDSILLVTVDSLRADRLGYLGYEREPSPQIDDFADDAVRFESATANGPTTFTSFPSLFTGSHAYEAPDFPHLTGPTVAEPFRAAGYDTLSVTSNAWTSPTYGYDAGFDRVHHLGQGPRAADSQWDRLRHRLGDLLGEGVAFEFVKGIYDRLRSIDPNDTTEEDRIHDIAATHIKRDQPTFTWVHYMTVHAPYAVDPDSRVMFVDEVPTEDEQRDLVERARAEPATIPEQERQLLSDLYDAAIAHVDRRIGDLLDTVDRSETVVCLTADHGEMFWDHGDFEHPPTLYQELLHVPLLVWDPGTEPRTVEEPVELASVPGTLAELGDVDAPYDAVLPPWGTGSEAICSAVAHPSRFEPESPSRSALQIAVRQARWKLLRRPDRVDALFDLACDPRERDDRRDQYPDVAADLAMRADDFAAELEFGNPGEIPAEVEDRLADLGYVE